MIWEIHLGIFLNLYKGANVWSASWYDVKGGGEVGHFYVFSFLHVSEHFEHILWLEN